MQKTALAIAALMLTVGFSSLGAGAEDQEWGSAIWDGNAEPNVPSWDGSNVMWQGPNQEAVDKIYFDMTVETITSAVLLGGPVHVPNANADGTHFAPQPAQSFTALLGYWRDCNYDGFIGDAVLGFQYPKEELATVDEDQICPEDSRYNDGSQIYEFLAIGPDVRDVAQDDNLCPERTGDDADKPRAQEGEGILDGGDNVACFGHRPGFVQDDLAKVWYDISLPVGPPVTSALIFPLPDGTFRDTNGHFKYVDGLTFGQVSAAAPGLWPTEHGQDRNADPAVGNQCNDVSEQGEATDVIAHVDGAVQGATDPTCSPVPNIRTVTLPVTGAIAWPTETANNRLNGSEDPNAHPTPITAPYSHEKHESNDQQGAHQCDLKTENGGDDWDDDPNDGDPFYGGDATGSPVEFARAYYGPGSSTSDDGPSLEGTNSNVLAGVFYEASVALEGESNADCNKGGAVGNIEAHGDAGTSGQKVATDSFGPMNFIFDDESFNPATAPGGPLEGTRADTQVCPHADEATERNTLRCTGYWESNAQWLQGHGANALDPYGYTKDVVSTGYADVSFGDTDGFDTAGDGDFRVGQGYFEQPGGLAEASALPAGVDDAHTYGDEQCDSYTKLTDTNNDGDDITIQDHITSPAGENFWSCDRNGWVESAQIKCTTKEGELPCYQLPKIGDPYDLRDVECQDADLGPFETPAGTVERVNVTDEDGPWGDAYEAGGMERDEGPTGFRTDNPNQSCQQLQSPPS